MSTLNNRAPSVRPALIATQKAISSATIYNLSTLFEKVGVDAVDDVRAAAAFDLFREKGRFASYRELQDATDATPAALCPKQQRLRDIYLLEARGNVPAFTSKDLAQERQILEEELSMGI